MPSADPVVAVVFCQPRKVDYTVVGGKFVVRKDSAGNDGQAGGSGTITHPAGCW